MMAAERDIDDGEFWLPPDFLTDDFLAETESDEEELLKPAPFKKTPAPQASVMATSPQSTLCGVGSWSFSSSGSPEGPSQVSSPPSTPFQQPRDDALDLLYAAAGQVERLGLGEDSAAARGLLAPPPAATKNHRFGFYSSQDLIQQQIQAARFYQLKRQQLLKQQQQFAAAWSRQQQLNRERAAAWPPLQKQAPPPAPGAGMTAVFLKGGRKQSSGTGVFLPRRAGTPVEPKKKTGCSTVLLPARVVQALNLNIEDMGLHPRLPGCYVLDSDAAVARSNQRKTPPAPSSSPAAASPEIQLPQEWTY